MAPLIKKQLSVVIAAALMSVAQFMVLVAAVATPARSAQLIIGAALLSLIWTAVICFTLAFVRAKARLVVTAVAALAVLLAGGLTIGSIVAAFLLLLILYGVGHSLQKEMMYRLEFRVSKIFRQGVKVLLIGLIIVIAGFSLSVIESAVAVEGLSVSDQQVAQIINPLEPVLNNLMPGLNSSITLEQVVEDRLVKQAGVSELSDDQKNQVREQIAIQLGSEKAAQQTLSAVVADKINSQLTNISQTNSLLVALALIILLFLTLRAAIPFMLWPVLGLVYLMISIAKRYELVHLEFKQVTAQRARM
jgi:hypothetical protein